MKTVIALYAIFVAAYIWFIGFFVAIELFQLQSESLLMVVGYVVGVSATTIYRYAKEAT